MSNATIPTVEEKEKLLGLARLCESDKPNEADAARRMLQARLAKLGVTFEKLISGFPTQAPQPKPQPQPGGFKDPNDWPPSRPGFTSVNLDDLLRAMRQRDRNRVSPTGGVWGRW